MFFSPSQRLAGPRRLVLVLACLCASTPAHAGNAAAPSAEARNTVIVREAFETWRAGGSVFEILAPDIIWTIHGSGPVADTYRGIDDFMQRAAAPLVSRLARPLVPEVHDIWTVDDTVIVRFDASSTTTSGRPYNNQFVWILRMRDGAVSEAEAFLDLAAYQEVLDTNAPRQD